jgi:hypothetical protein
MYRLFKNSGTDGNFNEFFLLLLYSPENVNVGRRGADISFRPSGSLYATASVLQPFAQPDVLNAYISKDCEVVG